MVMSWANMQVRDFLRKADELVPKILAGRGAIERDRRLPSDLADAMCEAGFFSLWLPKSMGGPELSPAELARVVEVFSEADG
jgi:alkylation response protein AidB-like acyl-CoA dehydrogenase